MRRYLIQSVVDYVALVLVLVLIIAGGVVKGGNLAGAEMATALQILRSLLPPVLVFSIVLTAIHRFARPLLVVAFGDWLMRSFGALVLILDMVLFSVAFFLAPVRFPTTPTPWWGLPVVAILYSLLRLVIVTLVGLDRPRPDGGRAYAAAWRRLDRLPSLRRNWFTERVRQQEVIGIMLGYGLDIALAGTPIGALRRRLARLVHGKPSPLDHLTPPAKVRVMLQQLGPTYVKFGQMAASQAQTLPPDWAAELAKLQSDVPPVPYALARAVIIDDLGQPPEALYATFDREALAAASTAQVHRATLHDGTPVAVKVQRPDIAATVRADLGVLQEVAAVVEGVSGFARELDLSGLVVEFAAGVARELDYRNEAYHALRLADNLAPLPLVRVPAVYPALSATRVLTMDFIDGVKVGAPGALDRPGPDRRALTEAFLRALIKQVFIDGFFHGDPHPGNILLDRATGALTYLDLGLVGRLDQARRLDLIDLVISLHQRDAGSLANLALRLTTQTRPVRAAQFRDDMAELLHQYVRYAAQPRFDTMIAAFLALLQRHGLRLDQQFTLAIKTVVQSQEVVAALAGGVDFVPFAVQEIKALALAEITRDKVLDTLKQQATHVGKELLHRVPDLQDATMSWLDQFMRGKLVVHVDTQDVTRHIDSLGTTFTRLTAGLIVTGMIIGTAIVTTQIWQLWPLFFILLIVGTRLAWQLLHPQRRP